MLLVIQLPNEECVMPAFNRAIVYSEFQGWLGPFKQAFKMRFTPSSVLYYYAFAYYCISILIKVHEGVKWELKHRVWDLETGTCKKTILVLARSFLSKRVGHEVPGVVVWPLLLHWGLGWEMLGDISYDKATLQSEGK